MRRFLAGIVLASLAAGCGDDGAQTASQLRALAESYPSATDAQIKAGLDGLSVNEHWILELVGKQFKWAVLRRACKVDAKLTCSDLATKTPYTCAKVNSDWQTYVAWHKKTYGEGGDVNANIELGRGTLIIYYKCKSGEIDKTSCNLYFSIQDQVAQGTARTSEVIVDNIGNTCRVGKDPGCYP